MAITRCPYCHAIVDETTKYCNNCGTQLLFPEDDVLEEDIPGEKIIDVEYDGEKDYDTGEPAEGELELEEEEDEDEEDDDDGPEEVTVVDEIEALEAEAKSAGPDDYSDDEEDEDEAEEVDLDGPEDEREGPGGSSDEADDGAAISFSPFNEPDEDENRGSRDDDEDREDDSEEELEDRDEDKDENREETKEEEDGEEEAAADTADTGENEDMRDKKPAREEEETVEMKVPAGDTFDTTELDGMGRTVDLGRVRLDKMLDRLDDEMEPPRRKRAAASDEGPRAGKKDTLPPWADRMINGGRTPETPAQTTAQAPLHASARPSAPAPVSKPASVPSSSPSPAPPTDSEEIFPGRRRRGSDSTIGLPERNTTPVLPFYEEDEGPEEETEENEEDVTPDAIGDRPLSDGSDEEDRPHRLGTGEIGKAVHGLIERFRGFRRRDTGRIPDTGSGTGNGLGPGAGPGTDKFGSDEDESGAAMGGPGGSGGRIMAPPPPVSTSGPVANAGQDFMTGAAEPSEAPARPRPVPQTLFPPAQSSSEMPPFADRRLSGSREAPEDEEEEERPPFSFAIFFKSKMFDLLFVGLFWLVALWLAGRSMDATLFDLLAATPTPLVALYLLLVVIYFFLFKFFLGETLGDRLFREHDEQ